MATTGAMIALIPTEADAARLALPADTWPGAEPAEQLHLTLWFLGEAAQHPDGTYASLVGAIRSMVERRALPVIQAKGFGADLWNPDSDNPAWVLQVGDLPEGERPEGQDPLGVFRTEMDEAWHDGMVQLDVPPQHSPWAPHVCLAYSADPDLIGPVRDRIGGIVFDRVRVAFAGEYTDILLGARPAPEALPGEVRDPVNSAVDASGVQDKYDPGQSRRSDGTWGDGPALADDKLGLAKRIQLEPGETLLGSREASVNGSSSSAPVLAAVQTDSGPEIRFGIVAGEDTQRWGAANKGGTAKFDASAAANLDSVLETEADNARRHQKALHDMWDDVDDAQDDVDELRSENADTDEIEAAQERLDSATEHAQATDIDSQLAEGVIPGSDWADIAYQVWGSDDPKAPYTVHLVVKPHDAGDDWTWDDATSGGEDARLSPADVRKLRRDLKALQALGGGEETTNTARLKPIRAFTADRGHMGRATRARDARMRARDDKQTWYRIENKTATDMAKVYLYSEIGMWGTTADEFAREMAEIKAETIELHVNSPGGEVFDGVAIYNTLKNHPARIEVSIDGLAASAASFIACAGDRIVMMRHAQMMIHDAAGFCMGNGKDMKGMADLLESLSDTIADIYSQRAGGDVAAWRERMRAETWLNAQEALALGLVDEVAGNPLDPDAKPKSEWDLSVFAYAGRDHAPAPLLVNAVATEPAADEPTVDEPTGPADEAPAAVEAEPAPAAEPAPEADPAPVAAPAPEPAIAQPTAWAAPAWLDTPADPWQSLVAGFTNTEPSTADDQLAAPLEATK